MVYLGSATKQATMLELPIHQGLGRGSAIGKDGETDFASAFDEKELQSTRLVKNDPTVAEERVTETLITDYKSRANSLKTNSEVSFAGWGAEAQAKFALEHSGSGSAKSVSYVTSRRIELGFEGWIAAFPPLSRDAKSVLEQQGPQKFAASYGDYFISGQRNGAMLRVEYSKTVKDR
jgi:hypothetical protein